MKKLLKRVFLLACSLCMSVFTAFAVAGCAKEVGGDLLSSSSSTEGETPEEEEEEEECEHEWEWDADKEVASTCTTRGMRYGTCKLCGEEKEEKLPYQHTYEDKGTVAPTCTTEGYTLKVCKTCLDEVKENYVAKMGHVYTGSVTQTLSCVNDEITKYTCGGCGDFYTETTARATGLHNLEGATWTEESRKLIDGSACQYEVIEAAQCQVANCGAIVTRKDTVHIGSYTTTVVTYANCSTTGRIKNVCACGEAKYTYETTYTNEAHSWVEGETVNGLTTFTCEHNSAHTKQTLAVSSTTATSAILNANALQSVTDTSKGAEVAVTENTSMQMDKGLLETLQTKGDVEFVAEEKTASDLQLSEEDQERVGDATVYNFALKDGSGNDVFDDGQFTAGAMTVSVKYELPDGEDPSSVVIWYIKNDGTIDSIDATYDAATQTATFTVEHFSYYTVVRLTAEERCARDGHKDVITVVNKTCTQDGYTLKVCKRCFRTERTDEQKATGHSYNQKVVAATCESKGYTRYTCSAANCKEAYTANYTAQLEHDYVDTIVEPTCTEKGHTAHECSMCGTIYRDTYVPQNGHDYKDGACVDCGDDDPTEIAASNNFYFNLMQSLSEVNSVYIEVNDIEMNATVEVKGDATNSVEYTVTFAKFTFKVDDNGYIVGHGEATVSAVMTQKDNGQEYTEGGDGEMTVVFQNGNIYMFQNQTYGDGDYETTETLYMMEPQDSMDLDEMYEMYETFNENGLADIVAGVMGTEDNPLNAAMAKVIEYVFDKTEVDGGYQYVLNYEHLAEAYTKLTTEKANVVYDEVFGEGEFEKLYDYVIALPDMTGAEFKADVVEWALNCGVDIEDVYTLINGVVNSMSEDEDDFDVRDSIAEHQDKTISAILLEIDEDMPTRDELVDKIDELFSNLRDYNAIEAMAVLSLGVDEYEEEYAETEEYINLVKEEFDKLVLSLKDTACVGFTTDDIGSMLHVDMEFDDFTHNTTFSYETERWMEGSSGETRVTVTETVEIDAQLNGSVTCVFGGSYLGDYDKIIATLEKGAQKLEVKEEMQLVREVEDRHHWLDKQYTYNIYYKLIPTEKGTLLVRDFDEYIVDSYRYESVIPELTTYNGKQCYKYTLPISDYDMGAKLLAPDQGLQIMDSCSGWKQYVVSSYSIHGYVEYVVYESLDGEILGTELDLDALMEEIKDGKAYYSTPIYYNADLDEFSLDEPHVWVLVDAEEAESCEDASTECYRCAVCGEERKSRYYRGHSVVMTYQLAEPTGSCMDGIVRIEACWKCGEEIYRDTWQPDGHYWNHYNNRIELAGSACGELYFVYDGCLCKEEMYGGFVEGQCEFGRLNEGYIESNGHNYVIYRCVMTDHNGDSVCGYTYTEERWTVYNQCTATEYRRYYLGAQYPAGAEEGIPATYAQMYTFSDTWEYHDRESTETWNADNTVLTVEYRCANEGCVLGKNGLLEVEKYDAEGRRIYEFDYVEKYGYAYEYTTACLCIRTTLDKSGNKTDRTYEMTNHTTDWEYEYDETTGIRTEKRVCQAENCHVKDGLLSEQTWQYFETEYGSYERQLFYYDYERGYGYRYEYDNSCRRTCHYLDENGEVRDSYFEGVAHVMREGDPIKQSTCTQFGLVEMHCIACNHEWEYKTTPNGHRETWNDELGRYECQDCGIEMSNGVNGAFVIEDMCNDGANGEYKIGYFNKWNRAYEVQIFVNYGLDGETKLDVDYDHEKTLRSRRAAYWCGRYGYGWWYWGLECGTITIDSADLATKLTALENSGVDVQRLTVVFSTEYNYRAETDEFNSTLEYGITFELNR